MRKLISIGCCFIFLALSIQAQEVRVYSSSPFISLNEKLQVILVLKGRHTQVVPQFPDIRGFTKIDEKAIVNMRSQGTETNFLQSYKPTKLGTFNIPSFPVKVGNNLYKTRPLIVKVESPKIRSSYRQASIDMSLTVDFDKSSVYVGEPVKVEAQLLIKKSDADKIKYEDYGIQGLVDGIYLPGFKEDLQPFGGPIIKEKEIDGIPYELHILHRTFFLPMDTGFFSLEGLGLTVERLYTASNATAADIRRGRKVQFRSDLLDAPMAGLQVKSLPKTKLKKAHTIGELRLEHHLIKNRYTTGEPILLTLEVKGKGNIAMAPRPELPDYNNVLSFDPSTGYHIEPGEEYIGQKNFVYELIPAYKGKYDLGPIVFYFFNPEKERYDSTIVKSIPISVEGEAIPQLLEVNSLDKFYRRALEKASNKPQLPFVYGRWIVLCCTFLTIVILGGAMIWFR